MTQYPVRGAAMRSSRTVISQLTSSSPARPDAQPPVVGSALVPTYRADDPSGFREHCSQCGFTPVRLDVALASGAAAMGGHVVAVAISDRNVQPATRFGHCRKP